MCTVTAGAQSLRGLRACGRQESQPRIIAVVAADLELTIMALETLRLEHVPESHQVHIAFFKGVSNPGFLQAQLLARDTDFEYAFIDASSVRLLAGFCSRATPDARRPPPRATVTLGHLAHAGLVRDVQGPVAPPLRQPQNAKRALGDCLLPEPSPQRA